MEIMEDGNFRIMDFKNIFKIQIIMENGNYGRWKLWKMENEILKFQNIEISLSRNLKLFFAYCYTIFYLRYKLFRKWKFIIQQICLIIVIFYQ